MPRKLRIEYRGAIYHVMNRGDRSEDIFQDDEDRKCFLSTLGQACQKTRWQVHAYCLMHNHFHLVIETPDANLVAGMKWLLGVYTSRFNIRHKWCGHLFAGRYKALIVDGSDSGYLRTVCDYVHLNPVRANLLAPEAPMETFLWSSYGHYLKAPRKRPPWLRVDRLLGENGIPRDSAAGRREFERRMEARRAGEGDAGQWKGMRRGWCLGSETFKRGLLERLHGQLGPNQAGAMRRQSNQARAEGIIATELKRRRWQEADLSRRAKSDPVKLALAARLRRETTLTIQEIADRLRMGSRKSMAPKLHAWSKANE